MLHWRYSLLQPALRGSPYLSGRFWSKMGRRAYVSGSICLISGSQDARSPSTISDATRLLGSKAILLDQPVFPATTFASRSRAPVLEPKTNDRSQSEAGNRFAAIVVTDSKWSCSRHLVTGQRRCRHSPLPGQAGLTFSSGWNRIGSGAPPSQMCLCLRSRGLVVAPSVNEHDVLAPFELQRLQRAGHLL